MLAMNQEYILKQIILIATQVPLQISFYNLAICKTAKAHLQMIL